MSHSGYPGEIAVDLEVGDDGDSTFDDDGRSGNSETTSVTSSIYRGMWENGRKYQTLRQDEYWGPSDDKQFETMEACETADAFPSAVVYGIDLFPPPAVWVPPNCKLEVDDFSKEWTWQHEFDLAHLRSMCGAFTPEEWDSVYSLCYKNIKPGGWIEHVEVDICVSCDDGSMPKDALLSQWGPNFLGCAERAGRPLDTWKTLKSGIEKAGFIDIHEQVQKFPIGPWAKDPILKDVGKVDREQWLNGLEGWAMWLLTRYGAPEPWSPDEVKVYVGKVRADLMNPNYHGYQMS
ncbi:MAG: hypothetical protein M1819_003166 [Sarea resinae]|nr:MAG: hypothetical protein M1819_003166 [Sarea resinae]